MAGLESRAAGVWRERLRLRKGADGLCGIIRGQFAGDPPDGSLFLFFNRAESA
jgi:hypothetical protein